MTRDDDAIRRTWTTRAVIATTLLLAACAAETLDAPPIGQSERALEAYDPYDPYDPRPPPPDPLEAPLQVSISRRETARVDFRFTDRTTRETGYRIYRSRNGEPYTLMRTYGALSGVTTYSDTTVEPETRYCYFATVVDWTTTLSSPRRCAYTPTTYFQRIMRAQLEITVGTATGAGTDDSVYARLNPSSAIYSPHGDQTWLDYSHNDFEPGSVHKYDLLFPRRVSDITEVTLGKDGNDGLCVQRIRLILNQTQEDVGVAVFDVSYAATPDGCTWIDGDPGYQPSLTLTHARLRAHPWWPTEDAEWCGSLGTCVAAQFPMTFENLEARLEGLLGHGLHAVEELSWADDGTGPGSFSVAAGEIERDLRVRGTLFGDGPWFVDGEGSFDFNVRLRARSVEDETFVSPSIENAHVNVDMNAASDAIGVTFFSGVGYLTLNEMLEGYIEGRLEEGINPLAIPEVPVPETFSGVCAILRVGSGFIDHDGANCEDLDGDLMNDEWERDNGLDPDDPRDATGSDADPDGDGDENLAEHDAGTDPQCAVDQGHADYCKRCGPCETGAADCDSDSECRGGRICRHNVGGSYGLPAVYDVCECPWSEGDPSYCRDCGPCEIGEADCDSNAECAGPAICRHNVGVFYGLPSYYDVCECGLEPGHPDYCTECGPCESGTGDCDSDFECEASTSCFQDNGESFDLPGNYDVCVCDSPLFCAMSPGPVYSEGY